MVPFDAQAWLTCHDPLRVVPFRDPVVEAAGHDPRSGYVELFWLPLVGPSAVVAARFLVTWLEESPQGVTVPLAVLARQLGLGTGTGRNAPLVKTLARLTRFGFAAVRGDVYAVRIAFPPLARRHLRRLAPHLLEAHDRLTGGSFRSSSTDAVSATARR